MDRLSRGTADWVAIILSIGVSTAVNLITFGVVYGSVWHTSDVPGGLSENATQVLTGAIGGMIGVLGAFVGYKYGHQAGKKEGEQNGGPQ